MSVGTVHADVYFGAEWPQYRQWVRDIHTDVLLRLGSRASDVAVNTTPDELKLGIFPYPRFPKINEGKIAVYFPHTRTIVTLEKFRWHKELMEHECLHDILASWDHPEEFFDGGRPKIKI